ncbi:hypothetical protein, conserved [Leishmania tarentolae]|uniref:Uncharacterized protein n=1 Tax=Leishmania tarentolae TaxID=5689 RepID=A0A640KVV6_LEITA|nr:hypothetical protein, conserved [Leishmania tarentolae]
MYMDILEQEVEHLSAEVMRLRLMVHRVTHQMESPIADQHHHDSHTDPQHMAPPSKATTSGTQADLQATLDSYKAILPLVQLLLDQQQKQQRNDGEVSHAGRRRQSSRHRRPVNRNRRLPSSHSTGSSSSRASPYGASSRNSPLRSSEASLTTSSSCSPRKKPARLPSHGKAKLGSTVLSSFIPSSSSQNPVVVTKDGHEKRATAQGQGKVPFADERRRSTTSVHVAQTEEKPSAENWTAPSPTEASVVSGVRAQRQGEVAKDQLRSEGRSNVTTTAKSQVWSSATSPSQSAVCDMHVMNDTKVAKCKKETASVTQLAALSSSSPEREADRCTLTTFTPAREARPPLSESLVSSKYASLQNASLKRGSAGSSILHSEQGVYNYSALQSVCTSPVMSNVAEDVAAATKASQSMSLPSPSPSEQASSSKLRRSLLAPQTSGRSLAREQASSLGSASEGGTEGDAAELQNTLQATIPSPYRSGVILGGRQPISVQSMTIPSALITTSASACDPAGSPTAAVVVGRGEGSSATSRTNLLRRFRPISSDSSASTSSVSNLAAFCQPSLRQSTKEHYRDSSFHSYSDSVSSHPPAQDSGTRISERPLADPYAYQSQDAYSLSSYSFQHHIQNSSGQKESDASPNSSRVLSQSIYPPQRAPSVSLGTSSVGQGGSISAGGYYYGYNLGISSTSQQSLAHSPIAEA